ncbi:MAG: rod shape-determining protein MreD [Ignavibacteriae bacterium]|nr:rod shape-determining protein MreD [Ignavibacteriota bacterium]
MTSAPVIRPALLVLISLAALLLQTMILPYVAVGTIVPDAVLIWIVYLAITRGHIAGSTAGFFLGLILDVLMGGDSMLGLSAFTKTLAGFLAGYAFSENKTLQTLSTSRFPIIVAITALVHNQFYFLVSLQGSDIPLESVVLRYGIPATIYTGLLALLPMFIFSRRVHS